MYGGNGGGNGDSKSIGMGAALQALKKFNGGGQDSSRGGGGDMHGFVAMAMSEAAKHGGSSGSGSVRLSILTCFIGMFD